MFFKQSALQNTFKPVRKAEIVAFKVYKHWTSLRLMLSNSDLSFKYNVLNRKIFWNNWLRISFIENPSGEAGFWSKGTTTLVGMYWYRTAVSQLLVWTFVWSELLTMVCRFKSKRLMMFRNLQSDSEELKPLRKCRLRNVAYVQLTKQLIIPTIIFGVPSTSTEPLSISKVIFADGASPLTLGMKTRKLSSSLQGSLQLLVPPLCAALTHH